MLHVPSFIFSTEKQLHVFYGFVIVSPLGGSKITTGLMSSLLQVSSVLTGKLVSDFEGHFTSLCSGFFLMSSRPTVCKKPPEEVRVYWFHTALCDFKFFSD